MPRTGQLRERITIQEASTTTDSLGGETAASWANISTDPTVWARVRPLDSSERMTAMAADAEVTHEVTVRYRSDLSSDQRIVWRGKNLYPEGPWLNADERREWLVCMARED